MRTDFAYVAMKLNEDDAHMFHMCFYETKPTDAELAHLLDELANDDEFNMRHMTPGVDFDIYYFEGDKCKAFKEAYGIPDDVEDNTSSELGSLDN